MRHPKTEQVMFRLTKAERTELERVASNERMTVSEYCRSGLLMYMALSGNRFAWKLMGAGLAALVREKVAHFPEMEAALESERQTV